MLNSVKKILKTTENASLLVNCVLVMLAIAQFGDN